MIIRTRSKFSLLGVGLKAAQFLEDLERRGWSPERIVSYRQSDDRSSSFSVIEQFAQRCGAKFESSKRPSFSPGELAFAVGWQYLIADGRPRLVVFHDSLLPKYRGFAPTVSALINGEPIIGVTALRPAEAVDTGPIIAQKAIALAYPIKIEHALKMQAAAMSELADGILRDIGQGPLCGVAQDESKATYSLWRDQEDYRLDWRQSAERLSRTVDALGPPYEGARAVYNGQEIIVDEAAAAGELKFEIRQPGKIWALDAGAPVVVCGEGLLKITSARDNEGRPVEFSRLRSRFS